MCAVTADGIKFIAEYAKSVQATAFLDARMFDEFHIHQTQMSPISFSFQLQTLVECLSIFGGSTLDLNAPAYLTCLLMEYRTESCHLELMYFHV